MLFNCVLALVILFLLVIHWTGTRDYTIRNGDFLGDMIHSKAYSAHDPNQLFEDGKTLRTPPKGTLARGVVPFNYEASEEGFKRASEELISPYAKDGTKVKGQGQGLFQIYCAPCHGLSGQGQGPVVRRGFPPPPSLLLPHARNMSDGALFYFITLGRKNMPGHGKQIAYSDRWKIIAYLRSLPAKGN